MFWKKKPTITEVRGPFRQTAEHVFAQFNSRQFYGYPDRARFAVLRRDEASGEGTKIDHGDVWRFSEKSKVYDEEGLASVYGIRMATRSDAVNRRQTIDEWLSSGGDIWEGRDYVVIRFHSGDGNLRYAYLRREDYPDEGWPVPGGSGHQWQLGNNFDVAYDRAQLEWTKRSCAPREDPT